MFNAMKLKFIHHGPRSPRVRAQTGAAELALSPKATFP